MLRSHTDKLTAQNWVILGSFAVFRTTMSSHWRRLSSLSITVVITQRNNNQAGADDDIVNAHNNIQDHPKVLSMSSISRCIIIIGRTTRV